MEPSAARFSIRLGDGLEFGPASPELILQWAREGRVPPEALLVPADGSPVRSVLTEPAIKSVLQMIAAGRSPMATAPVVAVPMHAVHAPVTSPSPPPAAPVQAGSSPSAIPLAPLTSDHAAPAPAYVVQAAPVAPSSPYAPPTSPGPLPPPTPDTALSVIVPYKNPAALASWYLGVFSLIPVLGFALAIPAVICGIVGLVKRHKQPQCHGTAHAILGILLGIGGPLFWVILASAIR